MNEMSIKQTEANSCHNKAIVFVPCSVLNLIYLYIYYDLCIDVSEFVSLESLNVQKQKNKYKFTLNNKTQILKLKKLLYVSNQT